MKECINFKAIGRSLLINLGSTTTTGGIIMPDQAKMETILQPDEPFEIVSMSEQGEKALGLAVGAFVYLTPFAAPTQLFMTDTNRYAHINIEDVSGYAPDGFNREEWLKERKDRKVRQEQVSELKRKAAVGNILKP